MKCKIFNKLFRLIFTLSFSILALSCGSKIDTNFQPSVNNNIIFFDDFERSDQALSVSNDWVVLLNGGNMNIINGEAVPFNTSSPLPISFVNKLFTQSNISIILNMRIAGGDFGTAPEGDFIIGARTQSLNSSSDNYGCGIDSSQNLVISKSANGTDTDLVISSTKVSLANGNQFKIIFTLNGDQLRCEIIGSSNIVITASDSEFSSGYVALNVDKVNSRDLRFQDIQIIDNNI